MINSLSHEGWRNRPAGFWTPSGLEPCSCIEASRVLDSLYHYFLRSADKDFSLHYKGPFTDEITSRILNISENTIMESRGLPRVNRKVSFLLVECFQNIIKHAEGRGENYEDQLPGMFAFVNKGPLYAINSINPVHNHEVNYLKKAVDMVNYMDREALKHMYQRQLRYAELNDKGGAGLGLIELARRSGQKLNYCFDPVDSQRSYFHQQVLFLDDDTCRENAKTDFIGATRHSFNEMCITDMLLHYKGDFSQRSLLPILEMVESSLLNPTAGRYAYKRVGHLLVEILQNISRHGKGVSGGEQGVFCMGSNGSNHIIAAGNLISMAGMEDLMLRLEELRNLDTEGMAELHRDRMMASLLLQDRGSAGLGLIEIAHSSKGKFACDFKLWDKDKVFFSLFAFV